MYNAMTVPSPQEDVAGFGMDLNKVFTFLVSERIHIKLNNLTLNMDL